LDPNNPIHELLVRVEDLIDALEVRGITSEIFLDLCKELEECLKLLPTEEILRKEADDDIGAVLWCWSSALKDWRILLVRNLELCPALAHISTILTNKTRITAVLLGNWIFG